MKRMGIFCVLLTTITLNAATMAQEAPRRGGEEVRNGARREQRPPGGGRPEMAGAFAQRMPLMMALDADQDGTLSASEIENASKALAKLDKDGDGLLSAQELRPDMEQMGQDMMARRGQAGPGAAMGPEMLTRMFEQRDANGDGKLTGDEIPERMQQALSRVDENGDGGIDKAEMQKAMQKMGDRAGQRPGRGSQSDKDGGAVAPKRPPVE